MLAKEIGEFKLIKRMSDILGSPSRQIIKGIGDDCAIINPSSEMLQLVTTDMLVEGVHFELSTATPCQIGWKSLAVNISDIASMGGKPSYAFVSIGFPRNVTVEFVDEIYIGMRDVAKEYGVDIIGGDTVSSPQVIINIALLGEVEKDSYILRSGAKVGDLICITGDVGGSSAGLEILQRKLNIDGTEKHLLPKPRLKEGQLLAKSGYITAMIDISDGVSSEINHICEQSETGAKIYMKDIPLSPYVRSVANVLNKNPYDFALFGGEDYELLFTCQKDKFQYLQNLIYKNCHTPITCIGQILDKSELITIDDLDHNTIPLFARGYNHFA
ncbi:MAG: thiamine-phosphate kinase [Candidatus Poribacteria bacterium]